MHFCSRFLNLFKALAPFIGMFFVIIIFHFTNLVVLKYYPVVVDFLFFLVFFSSIFQKETVIQKMAKAMEPDIKPKALEYTKNLTYIWSVFMFLNTFIALVTVFMPKRIWIIYNGFISYMLVGMIFVIEYIVRINFKRKYDC